MKKRKLSMRTWIFVLFTLFLLVIELTTELGGRRATGLAFIVFAGLKIAEFAWETFATVKQERNEQDAEESVAEPFTPVTDATVSALGGLDWMLHKINPDYDPETERNARNIDSAAVTKLDEMKSAGLIDEKEYHKRKNELAGK